MTMRRALISLIIGLPVFLPQIGAAHDFWLAPKTFSSDMKADKSAIIIPVEVLIGHPKDRMAWPVNPHRVISLRSVGPDGITDQQATTELYPIQKQLPITLRTSGLHVLTIETTHAESVLEAEAFNAYVKDEGILPIQNNRVQNDTLNMPGREIYSRRGKALIQVGEPRAKTSKSALQPMGMTLEIVPTVSPYLLKPEQPMISKIYYRGKLMSGVSVGLVSLDTEAGHIKTVVSDTDGRVSFPRPDKGNWMLHAVWSDPLENKNKSDARKSADYDTIFSSLSFGFSK